VHKTKGQNKIIFIIILFLFFTIILKAEGSLFNVELTGGYSSVLMQKGNANTAIAASELIQDGYSVKCNYINHSDDFSIAVSKSYGTNFGEIMPYLKYEYLSVVSPDLLGYWPNNVVACRDQFLTRPSYLGLGMRCGFKFDVVGDSNVYFFVAPDVGVMTTYGFEDAEQSQSDGNRFYGWHRQFLFLNSIYPAANFQIGIIGHINKSIGIIIDGGYRQADEEDEYSKYTENSDLSKVNTTVCYDYDYSGWFIKLGMLYSI